MYFLFFPFNIVCLLFANQTQQCVLSVYNDIRLYEIQIILSNVAVTVFIVVAVVVYKSALDTDTDYEIKKI